MELALYIVTALVALVLIWTVWQLQKLQQRLGIYRDYTNEIRERVVSEVVSQEFLNQLRNQAQLQLTNTVSAMDSELQKALQQSYQQLMQGIEQEATQIINGELEQYRQSIGEAKQSAANISSETEKQLLEIRDQVRDQAKAAIREEKQQLLQQLDAKLGDIISYYLLEALGENVDLGAQKQYILDQLESHKEEIKQDINDQF